MPFLCVKGKEGCCFGESNCYCPFLLCEVPPGLATPPANHTRMFQVPIKQDCSGESLGWWCYGFCCTPCAAFDVRMRALGGNLDDYTCCQGYFQNCTFPGTCYEGACPSCCLCLEACVCTTCSMSSTRMFLMDKHGLTSDPSDYQSIRINNTFTLAHLVTYPLGMFQSLAFIPNIAGIAAAVAFWYTVGGMNVQMINEIKYQAGNGNIQSNAPTYEVIGGRIV